MSTELKPKRPTPIKRREAELTALRAKLTEAEARASELTISLHQRNEGDHAVAERLKGLESKVGNLLGVLKPIHEGSKNWAGWPGDDIQIHQKLTWGAIRRAKDAYLANR